MLQPSPIFPFPLSVTLVFFFLFDELVVVPAQVACAACDNDGIWNWNLQEAVRNFEQKSTSLFSVDLGICPMYCIILYLSFYLSVRTRRLAYRRATLTSKINQFGCLTCAAFGFYKFKEIRGLFGSQLTMSYFI